MRSVRSSCHIPGVTGRRLLFAALSCLVFDAGRALAQPVQNPTQQKVYQFNIPAQPLAGALRQFTRQSDIQVSYPSGESNGQQSPGVTGALSALDALGKILAGTGLTYRLTAPTSVALVKLQSSAIMLGPVRVQGQAQDQSAASVIAPYAGGQVAQGARMGLFGNKRLIDTPFNITSYTSQTIKDQQARSLVDVLANDASVRTTFTSTGYVPSFTIRGFAVSAWDVSLDGLFGLVPPQATDVNFAESVEVLKGPSAFLNGMPPQGSVGGTINIVPKRAQDKPNASVTFLYASRAQFGGQGDVGRRFGRDGAFGIRLNGAYREGDLAVDRAWQRLGSLAVALDYRSRKFRASIDLGYQKQVMNGGTRPLYLSAGVAVPKAPDATSNWIQPWNTADIDDYYSAFHADYDLTKHWNISAAAGLRRNDAYYLLTNPVMTNNSGSMTETYYNYPQVTDTNTERVTLKGDFSTWIAKHNLSIDASRYYSNLMSGITTYTVQSNFYNPTFITRPDFTKPTKNSLSHSNLSNVAIGDTISFLHDRIQIFAGGRWQRVMSVSSTRSTGVVSSRYRQGAATPAVGIVLKPEKNTSIYGNYIQALQQGTIVGAGYANAGAVFAPFKSTQMEVGIKHDFGLILLTADYFQITQPSSYADTTTNTYVQDGSQRDRGFEINGSGELTKNLRVMSGVMWINGIMRHTAGGTNDGHQAVGTPHLQLNANLEWDVPYLKGLTLTGRAIYTSGQYRDAANTQEIPNWVRFDIGARYATRVAGEKLTFRGNIQNIGGRDYWESAQSGLNLGAPRTFLFSATADF